MTGAGLDVLSAINAGKGTWAINAKHFAERNGLFVIIAFGESIVGIGLATAHVPRDLIHLVGLGVTFVIAAGLWWSYFDKAAPLVETVFAQRTGQARGRFARDAYSMLHYPIIVGIVFFAVGAEKVVAHPEAPLDTTIAIAMAFGIAMVLVSIVAAVSGKIRRVLLLRIATGSGLIVLVWLTDGINAVGTAAIVAAVLLAELTWEHTRFWRGTGTETTETPYG